jgi:hypothetical protein
MLVGPFSYSIAKQAMSMITFRLAREARERKAQEEVQSVSPVESLAEEAPVAECSIKPPSESKPVESKPVQAKTPATSAAKLKTTPGVTSSK